MTFPWGHVIQVQLQIETKNQCHLFHHMKSLLQVMHNTCGNQYKHPYMGFVLSTITYQKKDKKFTSIGIQWHLFLHKVLLKATKCEKNLADVKN